MEIEIKWRWYLVQHAQSTWSIFIFSWFIPWNSQHINSKSWTSCTFKSWRQLPKNYRFSTTATFKPIIHSHFQSKKVHFYQYCSWSNNSCCSLCPRRKFPLQWEHLLATHRWSVQQCCFAVSYSWCWGIDRDVGSSNQLFSVTRIRNPVYWSTRAWVE